MSTSNSKYYLRMCILQNGVWLEVFNVRLRPLITDCGLCCVQVNLRMVSPSRTGSYEGVLVSIASPQNSRNTEGFSSHSFNHLVTHQIYPWTLFAVADCYSKSKAS